MKGFINFEKMISDGQLDFKVYVYTRPHMRCPSLEYELYMGLGILNNIFEPNPKIDSVTTHIKLSFPERWLNIVEERMLICRIGMYYPNLRNLEIKTQSVYIIQSVRPEYIGIIDTPQPTCQESEYGEMYYSMIGNYFNPKELTVLK